VGVGALAYLLRRRQAVAVAFLLLLFLFPVWQAVGHYSALDQSQNTQARTVWQAILSEPLPTAAVLISNDRNDIMPMCICSM